MAKIENTTVYPIKATPSTNDYFIITDVEDNNATKNCKISSVSSSINLYETTVTVPAANVQNIATSMFTLIPAVAGKLIVPISIVGKLDFGTVAYDFGVSDQIAITTASAGTNGFGYFMGQYVNFSSDLNMSTLMTNFPKGFVANENLVLWGNNGFSNPSQGDGTLIINIQYRLLSAL